MDKAAELLSIKTRSKGRHQGLRKLSPDLIGKARDETAAQVSRVGLAFFSTATFCVLSLFIPDSTFLGVSGSEKINVPFAGPVSFPAFMVVGPMVLIVLRTYLQIYVEHSDRLDRIARSVSIVRAPTLVPLQNWLIWLFSVFIFYMLLPLVSILFAWKVALFPDRAWGLLGVAVAVIAIHVLLPLRELTWRSKGILSVGAAIVIAGGGMLAFGPLHRPFNLYRANLSGQLLSGVDLREATLSLANLSSAKLTFADLSGADLSSANLRGANLSGANLDHADLSGANLRNANLVGADLSNADLRSANLVGADLNKANLFFTFLEGSDLSGANLVGAANLTQAFGIGCGNAQTKLPKGLTLKECP
jgi:Pentapeptide repeats (8 copies)